MSIDNQNTFEIRAEEWKEGGEFVVQEMTQQTIKLSQRAAIEIVATIVAPGFVHIKGTSIVPC